jgi:glycosyltransferase involved in cell wall biosynthesis
MKLSVILITFNQEKTIARAIESALNQKTDFPYEILIGEDCSTDGTRAIVERFQSEHPHIIRLLPSEKNVGPNENFRRTRVVSTGEYLAALEGDDYWTSPHKLQRQVDFLDRHPECSLCFHNATIVYVDSERPSHPYCRPEQKEFSDFEDILAENFIPTCAVVYRGQLRAEVPVRALRLRMGDWPQNIAYSLRGRLGYINDIMAVYTRHESGVWSGASTQDKIASITEMYELVNEWTKGRHDALVRAFILRWTSHFQFDDATTRFGRLMSERNDTVQTLRRQIEQQAERHAAVEEEHRQRAARMTTERIEIAQHFQARIRTLSRENNALRKQLEALFRQISREPALAAPPVSKKATGHLGSTGTTRELRGWAWDPSQPDLAVAVSFYEDDVLLATVLADVPRPALVKRGQMHGNHGFALPLPPPLRDGRPHLIRAQIAGANIELKSSPQIHVYPVDKGQSAPAGLEDCVPSPDGCVEEAVRKAPRGEPTS